MLKVFLIAGFIGLLWGLTAPADWQEKIDRHNALFAEDDTGDFNVEGYPGIYLVKCKNFDSIDTPLSSFMLINVNHSR